MVGLNYHGAGGYGIWLCAVLWWAYTEAQGVAEVNLSTILTCLVLISLSHVLRLCHSFKVSVLPSSLRLHCRRPGFDPWSWKDPRRRTRQASPVFLPGESPWTEVPGQLQSMGLQRVRQPFPPVSEVAWNRRAWKKRNTDLTGSLSQLSSNPGCTTH